MLLVDSCVWIDWLKGRSTRAVSLLKEIGEKRTPELCISSIIYFEVLRGIQLDFEKKIIQRAFDSLERKDYFNSGFDSLVAIYRDVEKKGFTLKKLGDWLILKTVLDHELTLLTSDRDFLRLQKIIPFSVKPR